MDIMYFPAISYIFLKSHLLLILIWHSWQQSSRKQAIPDLLAFCTSEDGAVAVRICLHPPPLPLTLPVVPVIPHSPPALDLPVCPHMPAAVRTLTSNLEHHPALEDLLPEK